MCFGIYIMTQRHPRQARGSASEAVSVIALLLPLGAPERRLSDIVDVMDRALEWLQRRTRT